MKRDTEKYKRATPEERQRMDQESLDKIADAERTILASDPS